MIDWLIDWLIDIYSQQTRMFWLFSQYDIIDLQNVNKPSGVHFPTLLRQFARFLIVVNTQIGLIIIKYRRWGVYFNNQQTVAFDLYISQVVLNKCVLWKRSFKKICELAQTQSLTICTSLRCITYKYAFQKFTVPICPLCLFVWHHFTQYHIKSKIKITKI